MSLKAIEMQVALPRTMDAGKIQEQLQQRGQNMAAQANETAKKEVGIQQNSVMSNDHSDQAKLHKDKQNENQEKHGHNQKEEKTKEKQQEHHPYKGTIIDYIG